MISFERILNWKGFPISQAIKQLSDYNALSITQKTKRLELYKKEIVNYHISHNDFYKNLVGNRRDSSWEELPIIRKGDLQRPLEDLLSDEFKISTVYVANTSGSSGHPFFFAKDKFAHALGWAYILDSYRKLGITHRSKQARFYGIPLDRISYAKEIIKDYAMNRRRFIVFDLSDQMLERFLERFRKNNFQYIYGYTNSLLLFAKFLANQNIVLKNECPLLQLCIVTSEVCTEEDRFYLNKVFGIPVVREYGASELDVIAIEDLSNRWLINDFTLFVEVLDDNNEPVPVGCEGKLVITSLVNKAMPFIRYEVGDIGVLGMDARGLFLQQLSGRVNDTILLPSGKKSPGFTFYYISRSILESSGVLKEFVIRQVSIDTFVFDVVAYSPLKENEISQIKRIMDQYLEPGLKLIINQVESILRPPSGKIKHFYSELKG